MRRVAVLTSGGDAPGMNAAIRAVVRSGEALGFDIVGIRGGFAGLIEGMLEPLDARAVSGILHWGGTILGTARSREFRTSEGRRQALTHLALAEVEGLVVIGGEGSFRGAAALSRESHVRVVGIPGTIDNDVGGCDFSLGFDTAVNTALESIDRIRDTAASHGRLFFIEVMGRRSGWIALYCGLAGGATEIVVPEQPTDVGRIREHVRASFALGKRFCLVVIAEGGAEGAAHSSAQEIADAVTDGLGDVDYRVVALGHIQRGGPPSMRDRILGARLGNAAVQALRDGADRLMVGEQAGAVLRTPFERAWSEAPVPPKELFELMDRLAR